MPGRKLKRFEEGEINASFLQPENCFLRLNGITDMAGDIRSDTSYTAGQKAAIGAGLVIGGVFIGLAAAGGGGGGDFSGLGGDVLGAKNVDGMYIRGSIHGKEQDLIKLDLGYVEENRQRVIQILPRPKKALLEHMRSGDTIALSLPRMDGGNLANGHGSMDTVVFNHKGQIVDCQMGTIGASMLNREWLLEGKNIFGVEEKKFPQWSHGAPAAMQRQMIEQGLRSPYANLQQTLEQSSPSGQAMTTDPHLQQFMDAQRQQGSTSPAIQQATAPSPNQQRIVHQKPSIGSIALKMVGGTAMLGIAVAASILGFPIGTIIGGVPGVWGAWKAWKSGIQDIMERRQISALESQQAPATATAQSTAETGKGISAPNVSPNPTPNLSQQGSRTLQ